MQLDKTSRGKNCEHKNRIKRDVKKPTFRRSARVFAFEFCQQTRRVSLVASLALVGHAFGT